MSSSRWVCAALVAVLPLAALAKGRKAARGKAESKPVNVTDVLAEAKQSMAEGDFDKAISKLEAGAAKLTDPADLARVHLQRALCYTALRQTPMAKKAFAAALE